MCIIAGFDCMGYGGRLQDQIVVLIIGIIFAHSVWLWWSIDNKGISDNGSDVITISIGTPITFIDGAVGIYTIFAQVLQYWVPPLNYPR